MPPRRDKNADKDTGAVPKQPITRQDLEVGLAQAGTVEGAAALPEGAIAPQLPDPPAHEDANLTGQSDYYLVSENVGANVKLNLRAKYAACDPFIPKEAQPLTRDYNSTLTSNIGRLNEATTVNTQNLMRLTTKLNVMPDAHAMERQIRDLADKLKHIESVTLQKTQEYIDTTNVKTVIDETAYSKNLDKQFNNAMVIFSTTVEHSMLRAKAVGSGFKPESFNGQDMGQFTEWSTHIISIINLLRPTEANACAMVFAALRGKAGEMARHLSQQGLDNFPKVMQQLDSLFNTAGTRQVAANIFGSFSQKDDMPVQDYALAIEHLFRRAYPYEQIDFNTFLIDRFIAGLSSPEIRVKMRTPPLSVSFREAVNSAMAHSAALYPDSQTPRSRSLAWKMAASVSHPLATKPLSGNGTRDGIRSLTSDPTQDHIMAIRASCTLHPNSNHSNAECRMQHSAPAQSKPVKSTKKATKTTKRVRFRNPKAKKRFIRALEEVEGLDASDFEIEDSDESAEESSTDNDLSTADQKVVSQSVMSIQWADDSDSEQPQMASINSIHVTPEQDVEDRLALEPDAEDMDIESSISDLGSQVMAAHEEYSQSNPAPSHGIAQEVSHSENNSPASHPASNEPPPNLMQVDEEYSPSASPSVNVPPPRRTHKTHKRKMSMQARAVSPTYPPLPDTQGPKVLVPTRPLPEYRVTHGKSVKLVGTLRRPSTVNPSWFSETEEEARKATAGIEQAVECLKDTVKVPAGISGAKEQRSLPRGRGRGKPSRTRAASSSAIQHRDFDLRSRIQRPHAPDLRQKLPQSVDTLAFDNLSLTTSRAPSSHTVVTFKPLQELDPRDALPEGLQHLATTPITTPSFRGELMTELERSSKNWPPSTDDESSDIETLTGKVKEHMWSTPSGSKVRYVPNPDQTLCRDFAATVLTHEPNRWNPMVVQGNSANFYQAYFKDYHLSREVFSKSREHLIKFNTRITRADPGQEDKSTVTELKLMDDKITTALVAIYDVFETVFRYEDRGFIDYIKNGVLLPGVESIAHIYTSTRCRSCHRSAHTPNKNSRSLQFQNKLKYLAYVDTDYFRLAEDHQAVLILERSKLPRSEASKEDPHQLGFSDSEIHMIRNLPPIEKEAFLKQVEALVTCVRTVKTIKRSPHDKEPPTLFAHEITPDGYKKIREMRRMQLLKLAREILNRAVLRQNGLISIFGNK